MSDTPQTLTALVGKNIADRRHNLGISQALMAEKLQITQDALSRMEKGKIAPKMERLRDIANALDCSVAYLFREADEAVEETAIHIAEVIRQLPYERQEAILKVVNEMAHVLSL